MSVVDLIRSASGRAVSAPDVGWRPLLRSAGWGAGTALAGLLPAGGGDGGVSWHAIEGIAAQILLPALRSTLELLGAAQPPAASDDHLGFGNFRTCRFLGRGKGSYLDIFASSGRQRHRGWLRFHLLWCGLYRAWAQRIDRALAGSG